MTFADTVRFLFSLGPELKTVKWDLVRVSALLAEVGDPHRRARYLHVAGTNGKGSTCAMLASALRAAGFRTGLYTSPHLIDARERIQVDGELVGETAWVEAFEETHAAAERLLARDLIDAHPSFFETVTVMAFLVFARAQVEVAVIEVGLGGRLDATNVIDPEIAVITPIDFDHEAFLGSSIESIAAEKAGILKAGRPAVFSDNARRRWKFSSTARWRSISRSGILPHGGWKICASKNSAAASLCWPMTKSPSSVRWRASIRWRMRARPWRLSTCLVCPRR